MPHTHLIEFEDFLANTGSEIHDLPQHGELQEVDRPHCEAVVKDVVSEFKASLKGKPRLWFEIQYPLQMMNQKQCRHIKICCLLSQQNTIP